MLKFMINPVLEEKIFTLLFLMLLILIISTNLKAQNGWFTQNSGTTYDLKSVSFVNANTGFVVGGITTAPFTSYGVILKTTNGGMNWFSLDSLPAIASAVRFWDENTGYVTDISYDWVPPNHSHVHIYKTTNGGNSFGGGYFWSVPTPQYIFLTGSESGYVVGDNGSVWKITDSLISYSNISNGKDLYSAFFLDMLTGFAVGGLFSGIIVRTTNGGISWNTITSGVNNVLRSIYFANNSIGYICGYGIILKTTNAGNNWFGLSTGSIGQRMWRSLYFTSIDTGYISSESGSIIIKTTNGGVNWDSQYVPTSVNLNSMCFPVNDTGFVVGDNGVILKTVTGGLTNVWQTNNVMPESFKLRQNYPNPFNPTTKIKFDLNKLSQTKLIVYNILGKEVAVLVNEKLNAGSYAVSWDGSDYTSGVYFYKLETEEFTNTKKMVLLK